MTFEQGAIVGILLAMLATYATERFRVELVAMTGLGAGFVLGVVPVQSVFAGFSSPAVITVAEVLLIVAALSASRAVDNFSRWLVKGVKSEGLALVILYLTAGAISIFINNIGALALMFPVTLSVCARMKIAPGKVLMPLSFATLLTGTCSLTGTPANLVVNEWMIAETGAGFGYFELALLGGPVALAGLAWIILVSPHVLRRFEGAEAPLDAGPSDFVAEYVIPAGSELVGLHLPDAESRFDISIHGVVRNRAHVFARRQDIALATGDTIVAEGDLQLLGQLCEDDQLRLSDAAFASEADERIEAVVMPDSLTIGSRLDEILAFAERSVRVEGLASRRHRIEGRFGELQLGMGDVLILAGERGAIREAAADCGLLLLSARRPAAGRPRAVAGVVFFAIGVLLTAFNVVSPEIAFGAVVIALAAFGILNLRSALQDLNWSIVVLLACMIPLGLAVEETGAARVIANAFAEHLPFSSPLAVTAAVLVLAAIITPFIDNVSTAVVLSPIAAGVATRTGVPIEPLLMAVAVGASLDFLTPFGHHNNAVVMGAAGYRFLDFPRFGGPLLAVCLAVAILTLGWLLAAPGVAIFLTAL